MPEFQAVTPPIQHIGIISVNRFGFGFDFKRNAVQIKTAIGCHYFKLRRIIHPLGSVIHIYAKSSDSYIQNRDQPDWILIYHCKSVFIDAVSPVRPSFRFHNVPPPIHGKI